MNLLRNPSNKQLGNSNKVKDSAIIDEIKNAFRLWMLGKYAHSHAEYVLFRRIKLGKIYITIEWRSKNSLGGRFGGGWNWHIGVVFGGKTVIIYLLVMMIRIDILGKEVK